MTVVQFPRRIVLTGDFWGARVLLSIEPRIVTHPTLTFPDEVGALAYAERLSAAEGWKIDDRRGTPPAAA